MRCSASGEESFVLKGRSVAGETELLFQLFYHFLEDPGLRPEAYALSMERFTQRYSELSTSIDGAMLLHGRRFLAGGDERFGLPAPERFSKLTLDDIGDWIRPAIETAPLEISLVGDFDEKRVIQLAARYFGSLAQRIPTPGSARSNGPLFPVSRTLEQQVATRIPKGLVVVAWPTADQWQIGLTRRLSVLGEVFSDRLRVRIREKTGRFLLPLRLQPTQQGLQGIRRFSGRCPHRPP